MEFEISDRILTLKKGYFVRSINEIPTEYYEPIPPDALLRVDVVNQKYIEITMLKPRAMRLSFSNLRDSASKFFMNFLENIKREDD